LQKLIIKKSLIGDNMRKHLVIFDLDGTLLTDTKTILESTKEAIKKLQANGHETVIATGRNASMSKEIIYESGIGHYIVCNGAAAFLDGEEFYVNGLDADAFNKLLNVADELNHTVVYETAFELKRRNEIVDDRINKGMNHVGQPVPEYEKDFYKDEQLTQALLFYTEDEKEYYEKGQFPEFRFVRWHDTGVDVLPSNGSKFETIKKVAYEKGYSLDEIIAFGDGLNDLEMIQNVGFGVAMGNALEIVKEKAHYVTESNNDDGILHALFNNEII